MGLRDGVRVVFRCSDCRREVSFAIRPSVARRGGWLRPVMSWWHRCQQTTSCQRGVLVLAVFSLLALFSAQRYGALSNLQGVFKPDVTSHPLDTARNVSQHIQLGPYDHVTLPVHIVDKGITGRHGNPPPPGGNANTTHVFHQTKIYLFTYYRGGSSILGEMFNRNEDVFYFFEPLAGIQESLANSEEHAFGDGTIRELPGSVVSGMYSTLTSIYSCQMDSLPSSLYRHRFMWQPDWNKSRQMEAYKSCITPARTNKLPPNPRVMAECRPHLTHSCKKSQAIVVKDIRMPMADVEYLLDTIPDLRIVYQIRDPRGILNSQWPARMRRPQLPFDATVLCSRLATDYRHFQRLSQLFPDRVMLIKYENFTIDPETHLRSVYAFAGLELPAGLLSWVWSTTHAQHDDGAIGTSRQNAAQVAYRWRTKLRPDQLYAINHECRMLLQIMEYPL